jgi:hypothetical protein
VLTSSWILWLAGTAAYTASIGGGQRCNVSRLIHCNQLVAAEAFAWIELIILTVVTVFVVFMGVSAIRKGESLSSALV